MSLKKRIFQRISKKLSAKNVYLAQSLTYQRTPEKKLPLNFDYVRYATLELCFNQIMAQKVAGSVAEVGVYKGDFSKRLNLLFKDRTLYLFDTFEGFADADKKIEKEKTNKDVTQDFSDTSIELVKNKMPFPEKCIFKKGYFPKTAADVSGRFCFVSLDTDLYEPIYKGLEFFYPRLENGGYIFVHDFNNDNYTGAKQAVVEFCTKNNIGYVPIPDSGGTAIITR